jgi:hypothetical protein
LWAKAEAGLSAKDAKDAKKSRRSTQENFFLRFASFALFADKWLRFCLWSAFDAHNLPSHAISTTPALA